MKSMIWIAAALAVVPMTAAAAQPQSIETPGTVPHVAAGAGFPERVGDFRRVNATRYDPAGRDISGSYSLEGPGGRLLITVYIYPAPAVAEGQRAEACRAQFDTVEQVIRQTYKDVSVTETGNLPALEGTDPALSHRTVFRMTMAVGGQSQTVRSEARLYCYVGGDWLVKYRASSSPDFDPAEAIETFVRDGPWPGRVPPEQTVALPAPAVAVALR